MPARSASRRPQPLRPAAAPIPAERPPAEQSPTAHPQAPTPDVYQRITDQIAAQIEAGAGEWRMPWHSAEARGLPVNAVSRKPYRGGNVLPLWIAAAKNGYESHEWATYKQWREAGAQVRKGEHSSLVVFWKFKDQEEVPDATQQEFNDRASRLVLVRGYSVFNAAQVDGYTPQAIPVLPEPERIESAEAFFRRTRATIKTGGGRAFYSPGADEIVVPKIERFPDAVSYYSVLAHELTHWTGHEDRLDRGLGACRGTEDYAREELVAELGAAFLCAGLGLANEPRKDNAAYVASWLKALRSDPKAIFSAASKAQYAADYLYGLQPDQPPLEAAVPPASSASALSRQLPVRQRAPQRGPSP